MTKQPIGGLAARYALCLVLVTGPAAAAPERPAAPDPAGDEGPAVPDLADGQAVESSAAGASATSAATADDQIEVPPGTSIGRVNIVPRNIFDLTDEDENNWLYRTMNKLHIVTRPNTIKRQLLFDEGEPFNPRLLEESERILRQNKYLYDASIEPRLADDGTLEVDVLTRDVWTLTPEITITRGGGENKTVFGLEESNLFGTGRRILLTHEDDVERRGNVFEYYDRQLFGTWTSLALSIADNSDGHSHFLSLIKPFHALDARWASGGTYLDDDRRSTYYDLGEEAAEYRHQHQYYTLFGGTSSGRKGRWVQRWTAGVTYDNNTFGEVEDPELPAVIPEDRKLVYPYVGYEILEDRYEKSSNSNQIDRAEDFYLGSRLAVNLGWADTAYGSDRDALILSMAANHSIGSLDSKALLMSAGLSGRLEHGHAVDSRLDVNATYYRRQSEKRLFFVQAVGTLGHRLDGDDLVEIGGDEGLRGYPLRYQAGDSRLVVSIEQRYFTDWYPFKLVRVGGAIFADIGRVWGPNAINSENLGWLSDVGFGIRLAPTRLGTTKVYHIDIAFPVNGADDIDEVQILLRARRGF